MKPWHMGTWLRVLSESYPMNTSLTGFRSLPPCVLDKRSLSIGRVKRTSYLTVYFPGLFLLVAVSLSIMSRLSLVQHACVCVY